MTSFILESLETLKKQNRLRKLCSIENREGLNIHHQGKQYIDFSSNDYLHLSSHEALKKRATDFTERYGTGSRSSRLLSGNLFLFEEIEKKIAKLKKTEAALLFNSGFQANITILPTIANRHSAIFIDKLCHNSLIQGALLSRSKIFRYPHHDYQALEELLEKNARFFSRALIVSESVFSMDGDLLDVDRIVALAKKYHAMTYIDEAHAMGIFGDEGGGLTAGKAIDMTMGTFGKAFGSFGAFVACSEPMRQYLVNKCSGFIYTTALPPSILGAIDAAIDLVPTLKKEREHLLELSCYFRDLLSQKGWQLTPTESPIIPIIIGSEDKTLDLAKFLSSQGFYTIAIRPPTVSVNQCRIRLTLSSNHTKQNVHQFIQVLESYRF